MAQVSGSGRRPHGHTLGLVAAGEAGAGVRAAAAEAVAGGHQGVRRGQEADAGPV